MNKRPILFNNPMVRAILEGRKTQTRRIVKPQPDENGISCMPHAPLDWREEVHGDWKPWKGETPNGGTWNGRAPYWPGDRLWVRERHRFERVGAEDVIRYNADQMPYMVQDNGEWLRWPQDYTRWRPSIHMPRWASRITLEVVSVRVERLQDISEEDAKAEGAEPVVLLPDDDTGLLTTVMYDTGGSCRDGFAALWASINGLNSWQANPWVWVVEFRRIDPPPTIKEQLQTANSSTANSSTAN